MHITMSDSYHKFNSHQHDYDGELHYGERRKEQNASQKRFKMMHYIELPDITNSDFAPRTYNFDKEIEQ